MDYFLATDDVVGISFWIATAVMAAGALFFFVERSTVKASWQTSLTVAALVCFVAFWHYMYMRDVWVTTGTSPTVFRYIDWLLTVPLLMIEFYFILSAVKKVSGGIFWRLLIGTIIMLVGGYLGEAGYIGINLGFIIGMAGWIYILYEVFAGEAGQEAKKLKGAAASCFEFCKWIVTIGWAVYPLGYLFGYMTGSADEVSLNIIYNLADFINKLIFGLVIWHTAKSLTPASAK